MTPNRAEVIARAKRYLEFVHSSGDTQLVTDLLDLLESPAPVVDDKPMPRVINAFISPNDSQWQSVPVIVLEDGSWLAYYQGKWTEYIRPLYARAALGAQGGER